MRKSKRFFSMLIVVCLLLSGCMSEMFGSTSDTNTENDSTAVKPEIPEKLQAGEGGIPVLEVYNAASG